MTKSTLRRAVSKFVPPHSKRRAKVKLLAQKIGLRRNIATDPVYHEWVNKEEYKLPRQKQDGFTYKPLVSIVVPAYNTENNHFLAMIYSVVNQYYENWELIVANASDNNQMSTRINEAREIDIRIKVVDLKTNDSIAENTNAGIKYATGEYICFLDHDDLLSANALEEVVATMQNISKPGVIYSDEDKLSENGEYRFDPHFKPDWSPDLFNQVNYINHLTVIKKELIDMVGGLRGEFDGAQDYDLLLRVSELNSPIVHIPKVLYHWRAAKSSTAQDFSTKQYVLEAGTNALKEHLKRQKIGADVTAMSNRPGFYNISYKPSENMRHTVIFVPFTPKNVYTKFVKEQIDTLAETQSSYQFIVDLSVKTVINTINSITTVLSPKDNKEFVTEAVRESSGDVTTIITEPIASEQTDWLKQLGCVAQKAGAGAVSPIVMYNDKRTIENEGFIYASKDLLLPLFHANKKQEHTYFGDTEWVRNVAAVSNSCFTVKTQLIEDYLEDHSISELDSSQPSELSIWLNEKGCKNIVWSFVDAYGVKKPKHTRKELDTKRIISGIDIKKISQGLRVNNV